MLARWRTQQHRKPTRDQSNLHGSTSTLASSCGRAAREWLRAFRRSLGVLHTKLMASTGLLRLGFRQVSSLLFHGTLSPAPTLGVGVGRAALVRLRCSAAEAGDDGGRKVSARLALTQQVLRDAEERAASAGSDPAPKITLDHVSVNFARSGGPGGQNVNKVNTKVDMRFNVKEAYWLGERIKERILQTLTLEN
ncbi:hypothetical protein ABZP36_005229 [Zizania latifolia]